MIERLREGVWWIDGSASNVFLAVDEPTSSSRAKSASNEADATAGDDGTDTTAEGGSGGDATAENGDVVLVDAGTPGDADAIGDGIRETGYTVGDVSRVLVTHYDYDHIGALATLDGLDAPVYAHEPDASYLAGSDSPGLWPHKALLQRVTEPLLSTPSLPVETVADGETVGGFTAYHTPGHGPGHLAWISPALETAFVGDLVRESDGSLAASPWIVSYDTDTVADSVVSLADRAPPFEVVGMGHGTPLRTDGDDAFERLAAELR
jgi:glyoxylase-like metal-dependent hydrolase (beta-lactamase superfamily II)